MVFAAGPVVSDAITSPGHRNAPALYKLKLMLSSCKLYVIRNVNNTTLQQTVIQTVQGSVACFIFIITRFYYMDLFLSEIEVLASESPAQARYSLIQMS